MRFSSVYCSVSTIVAIAHAAILRFPLSDHPLQSKNNPVNPFVDFRNDQHPLVKGNPSSAPLLDMLLFGYGLYVGLGTPPQEIQVVFDINWDTFFVQDIECQTKDCLFDKKSAFNSSASSSFQRSEDKIVFDYAGETFDGYIAEDVLDVSGVKISGLPFLDADYISPWAWAHMYNGFHAALGFAPSHAYSQRPYPSPWESITRQGLLDRNIFSIVPIKGTRNNIVPRPSRGELILGGSPAGLKKKDAIQLPLNPTSRYPWATSLESMSFGEITMSFHSDAATAFFTTWPTIVLPKQFGEQITKLLGQVILLFPLLIFACDKRNSFPDWRFGIGGKNITLNPFQYSFEFNQISEDDGVLTLCLIAIEPAENNNTVGLGWPFWENFRALEFDQDEETISLIP